jgi:hypothetical protein
VDPLGLFWGFAYAALADGIDRLTDAVGSPNLGVVGSLVSQGLRAGASQDPAYVGYQSQKHLSELVGERGFAGAATAYAAELYEGVKEAAGTNDFVRAADYGDEYAWYGQAWYGVQGSAKTFLLLAGARAGAGKLSGGGSPVAVAEPPTPAATPRPPSPPDAGVAPGRGTGGQGYRTLDSGPHRELSPSAGRAPGFEPPTVQSHHPVQQKWAKQNVPGYNPKDAPTILLETGEGKPHSVISGMQRRAGSGAGNSLRQEFNRGYREMIDAGVDPQAARRVMKKNYQYFVGDLQAPLD